MPALPRVNKGTQSRTGGATCVVPPVVFCEVNCDWLDREVSFRGSGGTKRTLKSADQCFQMGVIFGRQRSGRALGEFALLFSRSRLEFRLPA